MFRRLNGLLKTRFTVQIYDRQTVVVYLKVVISSYTKVHIMLAPLRPI